MAKTKISEYSSTANSNTDIASINIDEGCAPSGINNAIRALMAQLKNFQTGADGDSFNGPVNGTIGATTPAAGTFTSVTSSGDITINNGNADGGQLLLASSGYSNWGLDNYSGRLRAYYGSTEYFTINSSGNVGIGTSSPATILNASRDSGLSTGTGTTIALRLSDTGQDGGAGTWSTTQQFTAVQFYSADQSGAGAAVRASVGATMESGSGGTSALTFFTNASGTNTERARIDSSGNLLVGTTSTTLGTDSGKFVVKRDTAGWAQVTSSATDGTYSYLFKCVYNNTTSTGGIYTTATTVTYGTSSDYRLKENIQPMQNALDVVSQLNPVTYTWKINGTSGQGFIAHELQAVVPDCVVGEKDAVDADGNPVYQNIDTSFLVATLTAAIQEQQALITSLTARIEALEQA